ncbi:MAG TPA: sulfate adenylyltransferase subunit CysN [Polyangiaceae bacterium]|nr:sulfate adenylyltransferase subunit CysN [Polyangiaceae bacterium]
MAHVSDLIATDIDAYLRAHQHKSLLRFIACGSVDDGKSTLIGRLLYESKVLFEDQLAALEADSKRVGTRGGEIDYALLLDGLSAEREQGITIDVAYRFFSTDRRKFIVADTPGHEQHTRNMITGASTADLAVILLDARKGVLVQTRRHSYLAALIGIRRAVLAVNKMDLVGYSRDAFERIEAEYRAFARRVGLDDVVAIPLSGVRGDNVVAKSENTPWYEGPPLMEHLETVPVDEARLAARPFRMPVQWVNRPDADFRGFAGTVAAGSVEPGQRVRALPSGRESRVARVVTADGDLGRAVANQSVTLTLADEIDVSRGDVLCAADAPAEVAERLRATLVWMHDAPARRGRSYLLKLGTKTATATILAIEHKVDVNTLEQAPAEALGLNEIGVAELQLDRPVAFDPYRSNRDTGGFILIDRLTNGTVGAGMIERGLRGAGDVRWQATAVDKAARRALNGHGSAVVWLTGRSGAGKSTLADLLERRLHARGLRTYLLDGDNVRHGLSRDLGFTPEDRAENVRRAAEVAKLMVDAGLVVIAAFISPSRAERRAARNLLGPGEFVEVHVDAPSDVAERRDPRGLYAKARAGQLKNFAGVDAPYEAPEAPDLRIDTSTTSPEDAVEQLLRALRERELF